MKRIDTSYYWTVIKTQNDPKILKAELAELTKEVEATLSAGLVVLTEKRLRDIIYSACDFATTAEIKGFGISFSEYASRIMREVKEGNDANL